MLVRIALLVSLSCCTTSAISVAPLVDPIDFRDIFFDYHQPLEAKDLDPPSAELMEALDYLKHQPKVQVLVSGHADTKEGSNAECQEISERPALLVSQWLLAHGVESSQLAGRQGFGATKPIDFDETEAQRRHNRRVELNVQ